jgi:16S rRNA (guanine1516-N2)-methyltransferase
LNEHIVGPVYRFVKWLQLENAHGQSLSNLLNSVFMAIKLIKDEQLLTPEGPEFSELNNFSICQNVDLSFEWIDGQYWLHSDVPKERPIGIEIDRELTRHEEYFKKSSLQKELLAKAIGVKGPYRPKIMDLTAGMLGDSLLFLSFGCEVWASERHPVIKFLIKSALMNAKHPKIQNFHFLSEDADIVLESPPAVEVLYYDPMFEDANDKTSPRKEMRIFRSIVGKDQDAISIFQKALSKKPKRLVVKRPKQSIHLSQKPSVEYIGKSTRYDVYFSI